MANATTDLITVQTRLDPDVHQRLEEKSAQGERSVAAELRLAVRAWVGDDNGLDRESTPTTKAAA
jgi:hypothetical protein